MDFEKQFELLYNQYFTTLEIDQSCRSEIEKYTRSFLISFKFPEQKEEFIKFVVKSTDNEYEYNEINQYYIKKSPESNKLECFVFSRTHMSEIADLCELKYPGCSISYQIIDAPYFMLKIKNMLLNRLLKDVELMNYDPKLYSMIKECIFLFD